jgi:hypothetical protein
VASALGLVFRIKAKLEQRVLMFISHKDYVAAAAAIAAARAAARDVLLPAKGQAAVAAIAGFDQNSDFIDEHGTLPEIPKIEKPPVPKEPAAFRNCPAI